MVSEHEDRVMKGRILSPPAGPIALAPWATYWAEHVPTHDGGTHTRFPLREEVVVKPLNYRLLCRSSDCRCGWRTPIRGAGCPQPRADCRDPGGARRRNHRARSRSYEPTISTLRSPFA